MSRIITYNFSDDFIEKIADFVKNNAKGNDLSSLAIVFGGKRPALFLKKALAKKFRQSFIPPVFFSIDEFIHYLINKDDNILRIPELEAAHTVYSIAKRKVPEILKSREKFSEFLPWAREILSFIDQLDLEKISSERLHNIEKNAEIGYEVPRSINKLLEHIVLIRDLYHKKMQQIGKYSRGLLYLRASEKAKDLELIEFEQILFCNFFDLHTTEKEIIKRYFDADQAILFFQKDQGRWPKFEELSAFFGDSIQPEEAMEKKPDIKLYAGFDTHSQAGIVREVLRETKKTQKSTVIVLPQPETLIPLLSEITSCVEDFNVSMGYPLRRSTLYSLFDSMFRAQKTRKKKTYYNRDYLAVIMHPLIKNLGVLEEPAITRVLVHKIEEIVSGMEESDIGGSLFISLSSVQELDLLFDLAQEQLKNMNLSVTRDDLKKVLSKLHEYAFFAWENISTLGDFAKHMERVLEELVAKSNISKYPLNTKIIQKIFNFCDEFKNKNLKKEKFLPLEIFKIFDEFLKSEKVAFKGMPLKGLQILGLFETRALSFDNVIIMDVNESVLPRLSANEPLVPRPVMISLGLDRLEEEEGIQRYQFMRLINSAKNVHLLYNDSPDMQKSRFIEELIWEGEKYSKRMNTEHVPRVVFKCEVMRKIGSIQKDDKIKELLKDFRFSASSVNIYLKCPVQFYYRYVLGLREKESLLDELESREVGTFVHELLEDMFSEFINKIPVINAVFKEKFFAEFESRFVKIFSRRMKSDAFMLKQILKYRLKRFLANEAENPDRKIEAIEALEHDIEKEIRLKNRTVNFLCRIDRIDRKDHENIIVLDYKTGSSDNVPAGLKSLQKTADNPSRNAVKKAVKSFQLPLYLYCVQEQYPMQIITAALYNLRTLKLDQFPKARDYAQKGQIMRLCLEMLSYIIDEIHDQNIPFEADENEDSCRYCPFTGACR
ncbi:MAG: PD-(D/E)XK nuclease family protein [Candidatus Omnitrophica bacterium]|nr:PD-(D/E)XK nuclease family protein [Candidatus Omnitrophota bacterium]